MAKSAARNQSTCSGVRRLQFLTFRPCPGRPKRKRPNMRPNVDKGSRLRHVLYLKADAPIRKTTSSSTFPIVVSVRAPPDDSLTGETLGRFPLGSFS